MECPIAPASSNDGMDEGARRDVAERAKAIYEARIRPLVEREHFVKVVSIDVNGGDYEVAAHPG